jgi:hypothetical protein
MAVGFPAMMTVKTQVLGEDGAAETEAVSLLITPPTKTTATLDSVVECPCQ